MFREKRTAQTSYFAFKELEEIPHFVHFFTSRRTRFTDNYMPVLDGMASPIQLLEAFFIDFDRLVFLRQVHSNRVITLKTTLLSPSRREVGLADGVITTAPKQFAVIRTADCLPILVVFPRGKKICALLSGWRGTRDRITAKGVEQFLTTTGARPQELVAVIGPAIRKCCYEVGAEVVEQYANVKDPSELFVEKNHLDLIQANVAQLSQLGVNQILDSGVCTSCNSDLFYSYRRGAQEKRMWALAGFTTVNK